MRNFRLLLFLICLSQTFLLRADFSQELNSGWKFRQDNDITNYQSATVPGTIHTDLLAHGRIPDPFLSTNESKVRWVEDETWVYETEFTLTKDQLREKHLYLEFDGLDTYVQVLLNDQEILQSEDMFLAHKIDVTGKVKKTNSLRIIFFPASWKINQNKMASPVKTYPGGDRVFIRKAQYQFGWDWGPRLVTCGIWKPVRVVGWSDMRISDVVYKTDFIEKDTAYMTVNFIFESDRDGRYQFLVFQNDSGIYSDFYPVKKNKPEHLKITFRVAHPKLWWCNGMGDQNLYKFTLATFRRKKVVTVTTVTGIRKIELSTDMLNNKGSFAFILNDKPIYAMGSNWIPSDNFLPRVLNSKVSRQLSDMQDLNMNMVRVWGGGVYESDYFYSKCDSLGLLVWQDLPFACSMYPYQTLDKDNLLTKEVTQNVRRIASHPSIALWCGDNENKEGWFNWGWQKEFGYSSEDSAKIYNDYFNYSLKFMSCVAQHDPFFPYVMSSPQNGWGRENAYRQGDVHYWGVWWGNEPFSSYENHTGRFVSEFGFQSAPSMHSFKEMGANTKLWFQDSTVNAHQKHPSGFQTISTYMNRDYGITPNSFEEYVYLTQVMQRDAIQTAIEAQRRSYPTCMGSLFWQYNDCWPVTSWSVEDYYGRKKLAWYELKRVYNPEMVSIQETTDSVFVWVAINSSYPRKCNLHVSWISFDGKKHFSELVAVDPGVNSSAIYWRQSKAKLIEKSPLSSSVLNATLLSPTGSGINLNVQSNKLFGKPIEWNLPEKEVEYTFVRYFAGGPMTMSVHSSVYQESVMIVCDDAETTFSKNGFDLIPGQNVQVEVSTSKSERELAESIRFITMNKIVNAEKAEKENESED